MMLSVGVPMLSGGDEVGRTQLGNNNAYCQDNEISWTPWELDAEQRDFLEFTRRLIRVWRDHPVLRRRKFFQGRRIRGADVIDIAWIDPSGREMTDETWNSPDVRCLGVRLNGDAIDEVNERGQRIVGETLRDHAERRRRNGSVLAARDRPDGTVGNTHRHRRPVFAGPMADVEGSLPADRTLHDGPEARIARTGLAESGGVGTDGSVLTVGGRGSAVISRSHQSQSAVTVGSHQSHCSIGVIRTKNLWNLWNPWNPWNPFWNYS